MKKPIIHEFDPVIYPYMIFIMIAENPNIVNDLFLDYESDCDFSFIKVDKFSALTFSVKRRSDGKYGALIVFRKKAYMKINTICHESSHAAKYLFNHIGANMEEHEPFEYVIGWIAECIEKVKRNKV